MGTLNSATVLAQGRRHSTAGAATAPACLRKNPTTLISEVTSASSRPSWTENGTADSMGSALERDLQRPVEGAEAHGHEQLDAALAAKRPLRGLREAQDHGGRTGLL